MMQMLEDGDIGNLGDMQSVFLKTGGKWATKRCKIFLNFILNTEYY